MANSKAHSLSTVGVLHPGQMGISFAAALVNVGHSVHWASEHRSSSTQIRAKNVNLHNAETLDALCSQCQYIFSICPPDKATTVAQQVACKDFKGTYTDCNAVSPVTSKRVADIIEQQGGHCVDGGIIGPPAVRTGTTRFYLSGESAEEVKALFEHSVIDARVLGSSIGAASALKMSYAGWTKGTMALLMTQYAVAKQQNIEAALLEEWSLSIPDLADKLNNAINASAPKAWRFSGEMRQIADTLEHAGLPRGWFDAAAESYQQLSEFKNQTKPDPQAVINALLKREENS